MCNLGKVYLCNVVLNFDMILEQYCLLELYTGIYSIESHRWVAITVEGGLTIHWLLSIFWSVDILLGLLAYCISWTSQSLSFSTSPWQINLLFVV